jgi:hypothetical protein
VTKHRHQIIFEFFFCYKFSFIDSIHSINLDIHRANCYITPTHELSTVCSSKTTRVYFQQQLLFLTFSIFALYNKTSHHDEFSRCTREKYLNYSFILIKISHFLNHQFDFTLLFANMWHTLFCYIFFSLSIWSQHLSRVCSKCRQIEKILNKKYIT